MNTIDRLKDLHFNSDPDLYGKMCIEWLLSSILSAKRNRLEFENSMHSARIYRVIIIEPGLFALGSMIFGFIYLITSYISSETGYYPESGLMLYLFFFALCSIPIYLIRWVAVIPRAMGADNGNWSWQKVFPYNFSAVKDKKLARNYRQRKANKASFLIKEQSLKKEFELFISGGLELPYEHVHELKVGSEARTIYIKMLREQLESRLTKEKAFIQNQFEQLIGTEMQAENESWSELSDPDYRIYGSFKE